MVPFLIIFIQRNRQLAESGKIETGINLRSLLAENELFAIFHHKINDRLLIVYSGTLNIVTAILYLYLRVVIKTFFYKHSP